MKDADARIKVRTECRDCHAVSFDFIQSSPFFLGSEKSGKLWEIAENKKIFSIKCRNQKQCDFTSIATDSTKINPPGYNICMYWTNVHVQQNVFWISLIEVSSPHFYASFGTFCVQIGQLLGAQWVFKHSKEFRNRLHFPSKTVNCRFSTYFKDSLSFQKLTNLEAKGAKRSVKMWSTNFCLSFFKIIMLYTNFGLTKNRSIHTNISLKGFILVVSTVDGVKFSSFITITYQKNLRIILPKLSSIYFVNNCNNCWRQNTFLY